MPLSPYVARLRELVGSETLLLPSVAVLPRDGEGRLLLVRLSDTGEWATIGGTVEVGESPADAARREAMEEAGVEVELTGVLGAVGGTPYEVEYPNGDRCAYVAVVYGAVVVGGRPQPDGDETTEVRWFEPRELAAGAGGAPLGSFARALVAELRLAGG